MASPFQVWEPDEAPKSSSDSNVKYSREVPKTQEDRDSYNLAASRQVRFEATETAEALKSHPDQLNVGIVADFFDYKLMAAVEEASRAQADVDRNIAFFNALAKKENEPIQAEIDKLLILENNRLATRLQEKAKADARNQELIVDYSKALAKVGLRYDPDEVFPATPPTELLTKQEAMAAKLKLPFCPGEKFVFGNQFTDAVAMVFVASAQGLSIGAVGGIVSLSGMAHMPFQTGFCAALGISVAYYVGHSIKAAWRTASEAYYLGNSWYWSAAMATCQTVLLGAIEVAVDCNGLMAMRRIHEGTQALSGHASSSGQNLGLFLLCGAVVSIPYAIYCAFAGWRKERVAATNRIVQAKEEERLDLLKKLHEREGWTDAVSASNMLNAWKAQSAAAESAYNTDIASIDSRRQKLQGMLKSYRTTGTVDEIAVVEKARTAVSGLYHQYCRMLEALQESITVPVPSFSGAKKKQVGFWKRVKAFFTNGKGRS